MNDYLQLVHKMEKRQTLSMSKFQRLIQQQYETLLYLLPTKLILNKKKALMND